MEGRHRKPAELRRSGSSGSNPKALAGNAALAAAAVILALAFGLVVLLYDVPRRAMPLGAAAAVTLGGGERGAATIPFLVSASQSSGFESGTYSFSLTVEIPETWHPASPVVVFPQISGASLSVDFNGYHLGTRGDPVDGRSSIWNSVHIFPIPAEYLSTLNSVVLKVKGIYEAGLPARPYVADAREISFRLFCLLLLSNYSIWFAIGGLAVIALIVFGMAALDLSSMRASILLGLAAISVAVFLTDFIYFERLAVSLLEFKKIVVSLRHVAAALFLVAYFSILERKPGPVAYFFVIVQSLCAALVLFYPGDVAGLKQLYGYTYLTVLPLQPYLVILLLRYGSEKKALRPVIFGSIVAFLCASRDIVMMALVHDPGIIFISHFGFIVLGFSGCLFIVYQALNHYQALIVERKRADQAKEEALHDPLTGVYNRKILDLILPELRREFAVLAIDLDDLKLCNDRHGHPTGDSILIDLASRLRRNVEPGDWVLRTGGDEFLIILGGRTLGAAIGIADAIVRDCASADIRPAVSGVLHAARERVPYSVSIGVASIGDGEYQSAMEALLAAQGAADKAMYKAKKSGKGRWSSASSRRKP